MPVFQCPICSSEFCTPSLEEAPFRPFCSKRCKMIDLGRWLDGTYTISEDIASRKGSLPVDDDESA